MRWEERVIDNNNTGSFYNFVNKKLACKAGAGALRTGEKGNVTVERANLPNEFFGSGCTVDDGSKPTFIRLVSSDANIDSVKKTLVTWWLTAAAIVNNAPRT